MTPENRLTMETELLGWMMSNNQDVLSADGLTAEIFQNEANRMIAEEIFKKLQSGEPANPITLKGVLPEGISQSYLVRCLGSAVVCYNPRDWCNALAKDNQRSAILSICRDMEAHVQNADVDPEEVGRGIIDRVTGIMRKNSGVVIRDSYQVSESIMDSLREMAPSYSTGIARLDRAMDGGLFAGKSYGFAARKKVGKTILASTISCNLDQQKVKHLFICGEMSAEEVHQRTLARLANVYPSIFRNREQATPPLLNRIASAALALNRCAYYVNAPGMSFDDLKRAVSLAQHRHGIKGFILDYWQLVGGKEGKKSTAEHLDEVAQWIADYCRKEGLWSIVMAQINQEGNTRGGEGMRLAFDQVYHMQPCNDDMTNPGRWLEMLDTRYTKWISVGDKNFPGITLEEKGPYFDGVAA
jgi:replicative DNA helicase